MLKKIKIKGFRSFSQESYQEVSFTAFTVIVGENDTGKSNILKAIQFALDPTVSSMKREDFSIRKSASTRSVGKVVDKKAKKIELILTFSDRKKLLQKKFQRKNYHDHDDLFDIKCIGLGHDAATFEKKYYLNEKAIAKKDEKTLLSKISALSITPSVRDVNYLNILKDLLPTRKSSVITQGVKKLIQLVRNKNKKQEVILKKAIRAEKLQILPILKTEAVVGVMDYDFSVIKDGIPIALQYHGQGLISKLILSLFLRKGANCMVGIEEPEIHMHPNLIREIVSDCEKLRKKGTQIIIVTHSPYFTNFVNIDSIVSVRKVNRYTRTLSMMPTDPEIAKKIQSDVFFNRQKTEVLFAKGVIFVEGYYDRKLFSLMDCKQKTSSFHQGISIVDVGGDSGFKIFVELCKQCEIPWVVIGDRKAFYVPENNARGPVLKYMQTYVAENLISSLQDKIKQRQDSKNELSAVNSQITNIKGHLINLSGDDISDVLISILKKSNNMHFYKGLYAKFGGCNPNATDPEIMRAVDATLEKADEKMFFFDEFSPKKNELAIALQQAISHLSGL